MCGDQRPAESPAKANLPSRPAVRLPAVRHSQSLCLSWSRGSSPFKCGTGVPPVNHAQDARATFKLLLRILAFIESGQLHRIEQILNLFFRKNFLLPNNLQDSLPALVSFTGQLSRFL